MQKAVFVMFYTLMRVLGAIAPGRAARLARRLFLRARRFPPKAYEHALPAPDETVEVTPGIVVHRWGSGRRIVLLLHGWEGRHTQFAPLISALTSADCSVVAVDPPAHGLSAGRTAHPVAFAEALLATAEHFGPVHAVVGHSMGAGATVYALASGLDTERVVLISTPIAVLPLLNGFARLVGLPERARRRFLDLIEEHVGVPASALDNEVLAASRNEPALIVHDMQDKEMPVAWARTLAATWPRARLLETRGLGHRRILADQATSARIAAFIGEDAREAGDDGSTVESPAAAYSVGS